MVKQSGVEGVLRVREEERGIRCSTVERLEG